MAEGDGEDYENTVNHKGAQLRWLERAPDKREVGGSSPLVPTILESRRLEATEASGKKQEIRPLCGEVVQTERISYPNVGLRHSHVH